MSQQVFKGLASVGNVCSIRKRNICFVSQKKQQNVSSSESPKIVKIEDQGEEAWAGVAQPDLMSTSPQSKSIVGQTLQIIGGDIFCIILFAIIGRINHGEVLDVETINTALPFMVGWMLASPFASSYIYESYTEQPLQTAAKAWAIAIPVGLLLRSAQRGYVPPVPFIIVSFVANGILLLSWRVTYANLIQPDTKKSNKRGNPLEFMSLLTSLVKRW
eukprot:TRINITY_DN980_c0_g1_i2.p1 TRINITY_DN980_c0_g1~~TRINITY_DN980_c0_g1_i2.p1  ORF type:complete len:217 (-),score=30.36 TRINITY_DN980_c0_g1_i2:373-1023(-)